jgi:phosphohistidine phosphatase SixA
MTQNLSLLAPMGTGPIAVDWGQASVVDLPVEDLEESPEVGAQFAELPGNASKSKSYDSWEKDLATWIYRNQKLELMESPGLEIASNPGESERDFRVRLQQRAREQRDEAAEKLRQKYAPKMAALAEKKRRAEQTVEREAEQAKGQKLQTAISFGATLLSSFMGRKAISLTTLGRATTAARGVSRSMKEGEDVDRAQETVEAVNQQIADLDAQFKSETDSLERSNDAQTEQLETISLKPKKSNITVKLLTLAWAPYWHDAEGHAVSGWE